MIAAPVTTIPFNEVESLRALTTILKFRLRVLARNKHIPSPQISRIRFPQILGGPTYSDGVADVIEKIAATNGQEVQSFKTALFHSINPNSLLQRFIDPSEIASLAVYLASPLAIATNGAALRADGGLLQKIL